MDIDKNDVMKIKEKCNCANCTWSNSHSACSCNNTECEGCSGCFGDLCNMFKECGGCRGCSGNVKKFDF